MAFSIRLTENEKELANSYAKLHSLSLGEAFKKALLKKLRMNTILQLLKMLIKTMLPAERKVDLSKTYGKSVVFNVSY